MTPQIIAWGQESLHAQGYILTNHVFENIKTTPWSSVIRFSTSKGYVYLKQTPPSLFLEPKIMQILAAQYHASVPFVIESNEELHCFLMKDAGQTLREYLKADFQVDVLCQAIKQFTHMQKSTEEHLEPFLSLGVPDWRLDKLPLHYEKIINQVTLLKAEGMTDKEVQQLHDLSPHFSAQCKLLSTYQIPETIVQPDFNTNNMLIDPNTKKMTLVDLGEIVITHPFFSLHNYLLQATLHHGVKEFDQTYRQLQEACFENWLGAATHQQLLAAFNLTKKLLPIYGTLSYYRLMSSVDLHALKSFYADRPSQLAAGLKKYITA
jgi:hypothetical protein